MCPYTGISPSKYLHDIIVLEKDFCTTHVSSLPPAGQIQRLTVRISQFISVPQIRLASKLISIYSISRRPSNTSAWSSGEEQSQISNWSVRMFDITFEVFTVREKDDASLERNADFRTLDDYEAFQKCLQGVKSCTFPTKFPFEQHSPISNVLLSIPDNELLFTSQRCRKRDFECWQFSVFYNSRLLYNIFENLIRA